MCVTTSTTGIMVEISKDGCCAWIVTIIMIIIMIVYTQNNDQKEATSF